MKALNGCITRNASLSSQRPNIASRSCFDCSWEFWVVPSWGHHAFPVWIHVWIMYGIYLLIYHKKSTMMCLSIPYTWILWDKWYIMIYEQAAEWLNGKSSFHGLTSSMERIASNISRLPIFSCKEDMWNVEILEDLFVYWFQRFCNLASILKIPVWKSSKTIQKRIWPEKQFWNGRYHLMFEGASCFFCFLQGSRGLLTSNLAKHIGVRFTAFWGWFARTLAWLLAARTPGRFTKKCWV